MNTSLKAMAEIGADGFSPARAEKACRDNGGETIYDLTLEGGSRPSSGLWMVFRFPDGSIMNIDRLGCSSFSSAEYRERIEFLRLSEGSSQPNRYW